ncbi:hypothetical protein [Propionibacterium acidifaciens]|uniref:hypothetical protein n=1 Tax=Propionibacterium acidifaciens TaxID=556499 RepID=UPI0028DC1CEC|nr:hypothetical protein [Propionibacterium acidifaciens]
MSSPATAKATKAWAQGAIDRIRPHETAATRGRPLRGQRDRRRVLPGHEDAAEKAQNQDEHDGAGPEHPVGRHAPDEQRAARGAADGRPGGAGTAEPAGDRPEDEAAHRAAQQHGDDDDSPRAGRGGGTGEPGDHRRERGERQEDVDVVDPVADHAGAQRGTSGGRQGDGRVGRRAGG